MQKWMWMQSQTCHAVSGADNSTVVAFQDGKLVAEFSGLITQSQLDEFVENATSPSQIDLDMEKVKHCLAFIVGNRLKRYLQILIVQKIATAAYLALVKALITLRKSIWRPKYPEEFFRQARNIGRLRHSCLLL